MKVWIVLNNDETPVTLDSAPWGDGECLYNRTPEAFTVFLKEESAEEALETTKKYCKSQKLSRYWHVRKWKIISIDIPYSVD